MFNKKSTICFLILILWIGASVLAAQDKRIAMTIDDLPLNGASIPIDRLRKMTENHLAVINKNRIPAVGFVNESLLYVPGETDARIAVLKLWADGGVELGNHTFSHLGFKNTSLLDFEEDFIRGETVTKMLLKPKTPRYFRHPFLQMGDTRELEDGFRKFLAGRKMEAVPVTMDTMDWMFQTAYAKALNEKDKALKKRVTEEYLKFVALKIESAENVSKSLFGRNISHILLLHANELNGDNFEALVAIFKQKGYRFITVEEALRDEIYRFPDRYTPTSDWLSHWAFSAGKNYEKPAPPEFISKIFEGK